VLATAFAIVPSHETPIIPTLPVAQLATLGDPVSASYPAARPLTQSTTAFVPSTSKSAPTSSQPEDRSVPGSETNANA